MEDKYCTYLTVYTGNKLPPFYIGYSTVDKVKGGYRGTVTSVEYRKIWKSELANNSHLFKTIILTMHNTMAEAKDRETSFQAHQNVARNPLFVNKHVQGHNFCIDRTGIAHSEDTKAKMRAKRQGRSPVPKGSNLSEEHKLKIGKSLKGRKCSEAEIAKRVVARTGQKNNKAFSAESNMRRSNTLKLKMTPERREFLSNQLSGAQNGFYGKRHTDETKEKLSKVDRSYLKGLYWWTDGSNEMRSYNAPDESWTRGRIPKRS